MILQAGITLVNEVVPRLCNTIPHAIRPVGAEDHEELLQDATAMAARLLHNCEANGKSVTPGNIVFYTMLHTRSGRRFGYSGRSDVLGSRTQLTGNSRVSGMDDPIGANDETTDEPLTLGDVLASDAEDLAQTAARNLDWQAFVATLDEQALAVLHCMAGEVRLQDLATRYGLSRSTVQTWRNKLTELVIAFMGADLLVDLQRVPGWQENLRARREQLACRMERRAA